MGPSTFWHPGNLGARCLPPSSPTKYEFDEINELSPGVTSVLRGFLRLFRSFRTSFAWIAGKPRLSEASLSSPRGQGRTRRFHVERGQGEGRRSSDCQDRHHFLL